MNRYVIDASAAAEFLLRTPVGEKVSELIDGALLFAPGLLDVEVLSVLRRAILRRELTEARALLAIEDLIDWAVHRIQNNLLLWAAWQHRKNVTAYDGFYVAVAQICNAELLTVDGPLSRAPSLGIAVRNVRLGPRP
ncbi:MAG TPA: type II toxin-antitoxin system VapC family toxin [Candidatus Binatia bacterium]